MNPVYKDKESRKNDQIKKQEKSHNKEFPKEIKVAKKCC